MGLISSFYKKGRVGKQKLKRAKPLKPTVYASDLHSPDYIKEFANTLELANSEKWFTANYKRDEWDKLNSPFGRYIPDILNPKYKYIIEIDGSIHNLEGVKAKDKLKNSYYENEGYRYIRVKAYDKVSLERCLVILNELRGQVIVRRGKRFDKQDDINLYMLLGNSKS